MTASAPDDINLRRILLGRRLEAFAAGSWLVLVPAIVSILALLAMFAGDASARGLAVWAAAAFLIVGARSAVGLRVRPDTQEMAVLERRWLAVTLVLILGSVVWAIGLPLAAWLSPGRANAAFAIVGAALVGSVLLTHRAAPVAGIVHVVTIGAGLAMAEWLRLGWQSWPVLVFIGVYAITLVGAIRVQERLFLAAAQAEQHHRDSEQTIQSLLDEHEAQAAGWRQTGRDVPDQQPIAERVRAMAYVDPLTGLANRHKFNERLREVLGADGTEPQPVALLTLDLDDFRAVNDTQGHLFGDLLLREMGARLRRGSRDGDLVARVGGDEFALLVELPGGDGLLIERAHRLLAAAREPFQIHGHSVRISTSVGIARSNGQCDAGELMRRVDLALYAAKAKGRDQLAIFDEALDRAARDRRSLEHELREAVGRGQMLLHYQPIIALQSGTTVGYEALLRWQHPERGMLMADDILPIAEQTGLIVALGDWVIRRALGDVADWPGEFRLALNLSPSQIRNSHLIATVDAALAASGISAKRLEFAITEHALLHDTAVEGAMLDRLRALGAEIALDDFGTGYSSLSFLRRYRFDRVKIDRSFVRDIETSDEAQAIVSSITRLAQALGIRTTAEGIERPSQLDLLRKLGCDEAQGFLILKPVEAAAIEEARASGQDLPGNEIEDYREARRAVAASGPTRN